MRLPASQDRVRRAFAVVLPLPLVLGSVVPYPVTAPAVAIPNPILFVTQVPIPGDFTTIGSVFGNHLPDVQSVGRGGDLHILYPSGKLRNLTREAGFGTDGFQGTGAIAVREPSVHWSGTKALFSMVVGATTERYEYIDTWWQIYEVTGLGENDTAVINRIARQPANYNNVSPLYGTDGRILFTSDRPRGGEPHLHPQLDEYEEAPTNTGLWSLDTATGDLKLLDHVPSGAFTPILDSFGRVVYTRWDHLQRDQQADSDAIEGDDYGTFDYADESAGAARTSNRVEVFPEPRSSRQDLLAGTNLEGHSFNHFFPWQINEDGTESEILNHLGRHELHEYFNRSLNDDDNLEEFIDYHSNRLNRNPLENFLQIQEDPARPGRYVGVDAPEFGTHAAGRVVALEAPPSRHADQIEVDYLTHPSTRNATEEGETPEAGHSGHYRDPLPLSNGTLIAVHAAETREDENTGSRERPASRYAFRIKALTSSGGYLTAGAPLTAGIRKTLWYWDPDVRIDYSGELWELDPVEVRARPKPPTRSPVFEEPERQAFQQEGVDPEAFRAWLRAQGLAVLVSRDVTTRDLADRQQPFNLQVSGGGSRSVATGGKIYAVSHLQIFQADQVRGLGGPADPRPGRRVLARTLHDPKARNLAAGGPAGSVKVASDGSTAAFVPARRALTWQLTDPAGTGVVRERYWLTFQPGEVRACTSCHGPSSVDQLNRPAPTNTPQALRELLRFWKTDLQGGCKPGPSTLCLNQGRFRVEATWKDFQKNTGIAKAIPLTADTGALWFFDPANVEVVVKVLDGRGVNGNFWVFYGALSNVEYTLTVTDTATGRTKTYVNPTGRFASVGDTGALAGSSVSESIPAVESRTAGAALAVCAPGPTTLCLNGGRFRVETNWKAQGTSGTGKAAPLTADTGTFWFFDPANVEIVIKVLDGRALNKKWWIFYGALSDVEYEITVTDTVTGKQKTYRNPAGKLASVGDTEAL